MNLHRFAVILAGAILCASIAFRPQHAYADASSALRNMLSTLRTLPQQSFNNVALWARNGTPQVFAPIRDYERAEVQILNLDSDNRQAVVWWLQGNGRSALYARGATNDQIGALRNGVDPGTGPLPTPTPMPWRELRLASSTLGGATSGNIAVIDGFAAAKRDGTGAMACVSFKNVAPLAATRVVFEFPLVDARGDALEEMMLDRRGTFSPNIDIMTYQSFSDWSQGKGTSNRGYADNCTTLTNGLAALPISSADYATYRVTRVEYSDGSAWTPSGTP